MAGEAKWNTDGMRIPSEAVLEAAPDGMVVVDGQGIIVRVNRQAEELFGYRRKELVGEKVEMLVPAALRRRHGEHRRAYIQDPRTRPMGADLDLEGQRSDGSTFPVEISLSPVVHEGATWVIAAVRDITERMEAAAREVEAEVRERELSELKEQEAFRTRFINTAAHELNTPLTPVLMQLRILTSEPNDNLTPRQRESLAILNRSAHHFQRLVQDLLDAARHQAGRLKVRAAETDLTETAKGAVDAFRAAAAEAGVDLILDAPEPVPVHADQERLTQVWHNLLSNALKATVRGGTITVRTRSDGDHAVGEVEDNGRGLDPDQSELLFHPFSQVHEDQSGGSSGTGLGLYLCRAVMEAHGGTIGCRSPGVGKGCLFRFALARGPGKDAA